MLIHSIRHIPAAITWKSGFSTRSSYIPLPLSLRLRNISSLSLCRRSHYRRRTFHRCKARVSLGCAPKWTLVLLLRLSAVSQADIDETKATSLDVAVLKCDNNVPSRSRSPIGYWWNFFEYPINIPDLTYRYTKAGKMYRRAKQKFPKCRRFAIEWVAMSRLGKSGQRHSESSPRSFCRQGTRILRKIGSVKGMSVVSAIPQSQHAL